MTLTTIRQRFAERFDRYEKRYRSYARMRGFGPQINDWPYHRRGFIECWAAPGFHRFWQIWNPGISYFVFRLFILLGGSRRWVGPTILSFIICGVVHTLLVAPFFGRWSFSVITAFTCFGLLTVISRYTAAYLRQDNWPVAANVVVNVTLVAGSFDLGFRLDRILGF